jgi:hypothetical protein
MGAWSTVMGFFWRGWIDRFEDNRRKYITPDEKIVVEESKKIKRKPGEDDKDVARKVWIHILQTVDYKLSKKWKTPRETLTSGVGDCEDMDFLAISMMNNLGVDDINLAVGNLTTPRGEGGLHTWVVVDEMVVDPTGTPEDVKKAVYKPHHRFDIQIRG